MNSCVAQVLLILFVSLVLQQDVASSKNNTTSTTTATSNVPTTATTRLSTTGNNTTVGKENPLQNSNDSGMLKRSLYVAIGLSALVAIYFIVRWVKTKGRRKAKKYGVIHGTGEMELQPLDKHIDEDEEDMTLFDMKDTKRPR